MEFVSRGLPMDDVWALDGGAAAKSWQKQHAKRKATDKIKKQRRDARDARANRRDARLRRRKIRKKIERDDRRAFLKRRKAEGYKNPRLPYKDITGRKFGRLTVLRPGGRNPSGSKRWWVRCDCGSPEKEIAGTNLKQGILRSCGCLRGEGSRRYSRRVRLARTKLIRRQIRAALARWKRWFWAAPGDQKLINELINVAVWVENAMKKQPRAIFDSRGKEIKPARRR
jgi:hypothetical protein